MYIQANDNTQFFPTFGGLKKIIDYERSVYRIRRAHPHR